MRKLKLATVVIFTFAILIIASGWVSNAAANESESRNTEIIVDTTIVEWWMLDWSSNQIVCQIFSEQEGLPSQDDIYIHCGEDLYEDWTETEACSQDTILSGNTSKCAGFYLHPIASEVVTKTVKVELPPPEAWLSLDGCTPIPPENFCDQLPTLTIHGEEPLPNEEIIRIQGTYNKIPFLCESNTCEVPLRPTPLEGAEIEFWAESSFGDETDIYRTLLRVVDSGVTEENAAPGWHVELMSTEILGSDEVSCSQVWESFPPIGEQPHWLMTPATPDLLRTDKPYTFLAGRLIDGGIVDAGDCPGEGLEHNGYANTCGLEKARPEVQYWQNRFDDQILTKAQETKLPAQLIKNLFAKESQFWPGSFSNDMEFGLGQLTELGADTVLLWNQSFFSQFCPLVLDADVCSNGYSSLDEDNQAILRGALVVNASAACEECVTGIDLNLIELNIEIFAHTIKANCQQTGQIVSNARKEAPGTLSSYEDLWRMTLVNYHAGPGCLSGAVKAIPRGLPLTWTNIAKQLDKKCPGVTDYVEDIAK